MTYCVGIKVDDGMIFASDTRTNAGLDNFNSYSKMLEYQGQDRCIVILTSGNLATSQAVYGSIQKDLKNGQGQDNLNTFQELEEVAAYIGKLAVKHSSPDGINQETLQLGSTFIMGGQIKDQKQELFLIYPQGNFIRPSEAKPYLVIGEIKYGKPILDRVIKNETSLGDASRCALISMDSSIKSDLSVGPPIDFAVYRKDQFKLAYKEALNNESPEYKEICKQWEEGITEIFKNFPRFDWEK